MANKKVQVLQVTAKRAGFRRAGIAFGPETVTLPVAALSKEQVAALKAEPMLVVVEGTTEIEAAD
jgi:hypothetical protein